MLQIGVLLFAALITSFAAAPPQVNTSAILVYLDLTGCVHLKCEIEPFILNSPEKPYSEIMVGLFRGNETEAKFLKRQQRTYPFNTFTIMKYPDSYELSKKYVLLCNAYAAIKYKHFIKNLKNPKAKLKPKLVCSDNDKPIFGCNR